MAPTALPARFARHTLAILIALPPGALAQAPATLPEVRVQDKAAEERADGPVEGYRATRSSTFTRTDTPLKETPASVTVVPAQLVKDASMQSLADVFRYVPGVTAHQGEGNRDQVVIRGTSTTADFYLNGVRDDAAVFRDLYNIERVEVLKGPGGMIFGRGGAGGVVNRVTRKPVFAPVGEATFTTGSHRRLRGTLDVGGRAGASAAWRLDAMAERADSYRDGVDMKRWAVNPSAAFVVGAGLLVVELEHQDDRRTADRGIPSRNGRPFETAPGTFFGNPDQSDAHSRYSSAAATWEAELPSGWQLRNSFRATRYEKFYQNVYPGGAVNGAGFLNLSAYNNRNDRDNVFNQADFVRRFDTGRLAHTVLAGVELGRQDSASLRNTGFFGAAGTSTTALVSATDPRATVARFAQSGGDANNDVRATVAALYVQDQLELSPHWKVLAGVRYDRFKVALDDRRTRVAPMDLARTDGEASPRAGLIWTPGAAWTAYASYGYAFLPSGEQLGLAATTADLAPEKSVNHELGVRWDVLPRLTLSAALFRTVREDVRVADPVTAGLFLKTGEQRAQGAEIALQGEISRGWQVYGGYTRFDAQVTRPISTGTAATPGVSIARGNRLPLTPRNSLALWNKVRLAPRWAASLGLIHQGESFASIANTVRLPAFSRVDGAIHYELEGGRTRLALNVENLANRRYYPTVDGDNNISPGAPRNARLTVSHSF